MVVLIFVWFCLIRLFPLICVYSTNGGLSGKYTVLDEPPDPSFKDVNDQLMARVGIRKKEEYAR